MNIDTLKSFLQSHIEHAAAKARCSNGTRYVMWKATANAFRETLIYIAEEEHREEELRQAIQG